MLSLNMADVIRKGLDASRRPEDGLLHCSSDLLGSLRHAQLRIAGAPTNQEPIASAIRMMTGTLWHEYIGRLLEKQGVPVMKEVKVDAGLPEGWTGTLDLLTFDADLKAHVIRDVKTQRAEAFRFQSGVKEDHLWQLSAYHGGLVRMGYPMADEMEVVYVPMNALSGSDVQIVQARCHPLPVADLFLHMEEKKHLLDRYMSAFLKQLENPREPVYLLDELAPPPEREQRVYKEKDGSYTLKLVPNWRAAYCPFEPPLCTCSEQGQTKIGAYVSVGEGYIYQPREGYEEIEPVVEPEGVEVINV